MLKTRFFYLFFLVLWATKIFAITDSVQKENFHISNYPLERNGIKLFLEKISIKENKKPKIKINNILLVHGLTFSSHQFDINYQDYSLARFFAKNGSNVWLLDIAGYGRSAKPKNGFSVNGEYAANDIISAIDFIRKKEKVDKINLLGWSFGTISTSLAAAKKQEWINSLILYAPIYHGLGLPLPQSDYQVFSPNSTEDDFQKIPGKNIIDPTITDKRLFNLYKKQCEFFDGLGSPNGTRRDLFQSGSVELFNPSQLSMPVLLIAGTNDPYVIWDKDIPTLMKLLPNPKSKVIKIEGGSHIVMLEKPYHNEFQNAVLDFLTSTD